MASLITIWLGFVIGAVVSVGIGWPLWPDAPLYAAASIGWGGALIGFVLGVIAAHRLRLIP